MKLHPQGHIPFMKRRTKMWQVEWFLMNFSVSLSISGIGGTSVLSLLFIILAGWTHLHASWHNNHKAWWSLGISHSPCCHLWMQRVLHPSSCGRSSTMGQISGSHAVSPLYCPMHWLDKSCQINGHIKHLNHINLSRLFSWIVRVHASIHIDHSLMSTLCGPHSVDTPYPCYMDHRWYILP